MNSPRHNLGDIVRLRKGWTPMTVIGFTPDDDVIAQYGTCPDREDVLNPMLAMSTCKRPHSAFVVWDGQPQYSKFPKGIIKMAKRFQVIDSSLIGSFMQLTSQGLYTLEFDDGTVGAFAPDTIVEIVPKTFAVKAVGGNQYKTHYIQPAGIEIQKGEFLLSATGNMYFVTDVDTKNGGNIRVFEGQRLVTAPL